MFALQSIQHPCLHFVFVIFTVAVNVPMLLGADDYRHSTCSSTFQCGSVKDVMYPFWGGDRPNYCGHPDFKLDCSEDDDPKIEINSRYRVLDINQNNQTLRIARSDVWNGLCSLRPLNTTMNFRIVRFPPTDVNLTLFYLCPLIKNSPSILNCKLDESFSGFNIAFSSEAEQLKTFRDCKVSIEIPVIQETVKRSGFDPKTVENVSTIEELLRGGFDVEYDGNSSYCSECRGSGGQCGYNWTSVETICFCANGLEQKLCSARGYRWSLATKIGIGASIGCVLVIAILFICWMRQHLSPNSIMFWKRKEKTQRVVEDFLKNNGSLVPRRYNYYDIKMITSSFKDKIGHGGFGEVYKGKLVDGRLVAVKLLNKANNDGEEFINEVASISRTSHVNIVSLLGFCFDGSKRALIYEFMANGSLEKFIYDRNPLEAKSHLGWELLYQIAIGVARGLEYLHRGCNTRILHFDIKPHNILLDQDFIPKISDFGLAKLCPRNKSIISMLGARGTAGYIAPEVFSRQFGGVSHKSDVYSYGMMVLEIVGKRKNIDVQVDHTSEIYFPKWIYRRVELNEELGLRGIASKEEGEITRKMILVALWCIQTNPMDRPAMTKVVEMLEGRHESVSLPPKPYLCSLPRSPAGSSNT